MYVLTRGAQDTESVSILAYQALIARLNLGLGSAVSVLIFLATMGIALLYLRAFRPSLLAREGGRDLVGEIRS